MRRQITELEALVTERKRVKEGFLVKAIILEAESEAPIDGILVVDSEGEVV